MIFMATGIPNFGIKISLIFDIKFDIKISLFWCQNADFSSSSEKQQLCCYFCGASSGTRCEQNVSVVASRLSLLGSASVSLYRQGSPRKAWLQQSCKSPETQKNNSLCCYFCACVRQNLVFRAIFESVLNDKYFFAIVMKSVVDDKHWLLWLIYKFQNGFIFIYAVHKRRIGFCYLCPKFFCSHIFLVVFYFPFAMIDW